MHPTVHSVQFWRQGRYDAISGEERMGESLELLKLLVEPEIPDQH